jgi:DNA repair photolyase
MHMHDVLKAASEAGAKWAGYTVVRLNGAIGDIFKDWLYKAFPDRADKVWHQICECHEGKVNDSRWGNRMVGDGNLPKLSKHNLPYTVKSTVLTKPKWSGIPRTFVDPNRISYHFFKFQI